MEPIDFKHDLLAVVALLSIIFSNVQADSGVPPEGYDFCDFDEQDDAQSPDSPTEPSFCQEVTIYDSPSLYNQDDFNILAALATSGLNKTYPSRIDSQLAFSLYDEMPYPVPTGASTFFMVIFAMIFTWYFNKFLHWMLRDVAKNLNLGEETTEHEHYPSINLYMLQQTERESELSRDVRNTWAWLANFYLLKPSDPFVKADNLFKPTGLADYQVPRDVWNAVREVLKGTTVDETEESQKKGPQKASSDVTGGDPTSKGKKAPTSDPVLRQPEVNDVVVDRLLRLRKIMSLEKDNLAPFTAPAPAAVNDVEQVFDELHRLTNMISMDHDKTFSRLTAPSSFRAIDNQTVDNLLTSISKRMISRESTKLGKYSQLTAADESILITKLKTIILTPSTSNAGIDNRTLDKLLLSRASTGKKSMKTSRASPQPHSNSIGEVEDVVLDELLLLTKGASKGSERTTSKLAPSPHGMSSIPEDREMDALLLSLSRKMISRESQMKTSTHKPTHSNLGTLDDNQDQEIDEVLLLRKLKTLIYTPSTGSVVGGIVDDRPVSKLFSTKTTTGKESEGKNTAQNPVDEVGPQQPKNKFFNFLKAVRERARLRENHEF